MKTIIFIVISFFLLGCGSSSSSLQENQIKIFDSSVTPITVGTWYKPDVNTSWQWQLQGDINPISTK